MDGKSGFGTFPKGFLWGSATSAFQVEGHPLADGAGESIWTTFCREPGRIYNSDTADVSADQYSRWKEDVALMKRLGLQAYRFSLSWSRIMPDGGTRINQKGVDHYNRLIDELLANGIVPFVTVFHWDLPQALQDRGGWQNVETARRLGDFSETVARCFSDRVENFFTTNEIYSFCRSGYESGVQAPGMRLPRRQVENVVKNGCLAHGYAALGLRSGASRAIKVGFAENFLTTIPVIETPEHVEAAKKAFRIVNGSIGTVLREGNYPEEYLRELGADAPALSDEERCIITTPVDILGINIYSGMYVVADESAADGFRLVNTAPDHPYAENLEWLRIAPEAIYWSVRFQRELWGNVPVYISENGYSSVDNVTSAGTVEDTGRLMLMRNTLRHLQRAIGEGADVRGYLHWSFIDNFEWSWGYKCRFGLVRCDFATGKRLPKRSALYYSEVIKQNRVL